MSRSQTLVLVLALTACGTKGSGVLAHERRDVPPFTHIDVANALHITVMIGPQHVDVLGDDNLLGNVTTTVTHGHLMLGTRGTWSTEYPPIVEVTVPSLDGITVLASGRAYFEGHASDLTLDVNGAGSIVARGSAQHLVAELGGAGTINTTALAAESVEILAQGAGKIDVAATKDLSADISGGARVRYSGTPKITKQTMRGAGTLAPM